MSLQNNSLIVTLSLSQWTARKLDKRVTDEVNESHGASADAGRYNKLLANKTFLLPIQQIVNKARTFHYTNTLCWGDNGDRLLPSANYFTYVQKVNEYKLEFEKAVEKFIDGIEDIKTTAKRELNGMYREDDYPSKYELECKFNYKVSMMPVPDTDFRVQIDAAELEKLKAAAQTEVTNRVDRAVGEVWDRVKETLTHMRNKLSEPEAIFRNTLFDNVGELVKLLPKLNFNNDPAINDVCKEMSSLLSDPDSVRGDAFIRSQKAADVSKVLNKFQGFFN
jgi:hypothetical protein